MAQTNTDALVAADVAAETVKQNGGGDIATFNARRDALTIRRTADDLLAAEERDSNLRSATIYENSGRKGTAARKRENAQRDYLAAVKANADAFYSSLALFAVDNGYVSMVPADEMANAAASAIRKQITPVVTMLHNLSTAGIETVDLGDGVVWNVVERLATLQSVCQTAAMTEAVASHIAENGTTSENGEAPTE